MKASRPWVAEGWSPACPDPEQLLLLCSDTANGQPDEADALWQHVRACPFCQELWQDLLAMQLLPAPPALTAEPAELQARIPGNLPLDTEVVGRAAEIEAVRRRLFEDGIVQLVGPQGIGKTSIALEASRKSGRRFSDGVWWIDLRGFDPDSYLYPGGDRNSLVAQAVANTLQLSANRTSEAYITPPEARDRESQSLPGRIAEHLGEKTCLLILDNADHVGPETELLIAQIRLRCPFVEFLVTSQKPLPSLAHSTVSVGLMTPKDAELVARLVRGEAGSAAASVAAALPEEARGIALVVRLAATLLETDRGGALELLRQRLGDRKPAGGDPIREDVRTTIAVRYGDALSEPERRLLSVLALFPGGCPQDALAYMAERDPALQASRSQLAALEYQQLVQLERKEGVPRYRFAEPVREYLLARAKERPELDLWLEGLVSFFLQLASKVRANSELSDTIFRLHQEMINLDLAFQWCSQEHSRSELGLDLASALSQYWQKDGNIHKANQVLEFFLDRMMNEAGDTDVA